MDRRSCPSCLKRLPYAGRRCVHCGWTRAGGVDLESARGAWRRRRIAWAAVFTFLVVGGAGFAVRNAETLADWYAGFAAERLATPFSSFAPAPTPQGAYVYCARNVARQMEGEFSVETFPSLDPGTARTLGERRYRILSYVEQALRDGERVRHDFACTVRFERNRWVLEELVMEPYPRESVARVPAFQTD